MLEAPEAKSARVAEPDFSEGLSTQADGSLRQQQVYNALVVLGRTRATLTEPTSSLRYGVERHVYTPAMLALAQVQVQVPQSSLRQWFAPAQEILRRR